MRVSTGATNRCNSDLLKIESGWVDIFTRRDQHGLYLFFKIINNDSPEYLINIYRSFVSRNSTYNLRRSNLIGERQRTTIFLLDPFFHLL